MPLVGSRKALLALGSLLVAVAAGTAHTAVHADSVCAAATVRYGSTGVGAPWLRAGKTFVGHLFYYSSILGDARVNRSDGAVAYAGVPGKILWVPRNRRRAGGTLVVTARRLDGTGSTTGRFPVVPGVQFPSELRVPEAGCWRLSLRSGRLRATAVVQAVDRPSGPLCEPTPVYRRTPPHPRFGAITWMPATPRVAGVSAVLFVTTYPDSPDAVIPAGGKFPNGPNVKFLWWAPQPGSSLKMIGRRIDAPGRFTDEASSATGDVGTRGGQTVFPSIIDVPAAGCWSVALRTRGSAGNVVFKVVPPS
jgi:hypothetical protein